MKTTNNYKKQFYFISSNVVEIDDYS